MTLGIPDKKTGKQAPLGVPHDPSVPPANLMGARKPKSPSVPEFSGTLPNGGNAAPAAPPPGVGPVLPPSTAPVFPQDPVQPISFNGGHYNPTTAPYGFDMSQPGAREQFWNNNQGLWLQDPQLDWVDKQLPKFEDPWAGEQKVSEVMSTIANPGAGQQYWTGVQGEFNTMGNNVTGGYKGPNNAQEAYNMTKGMLPGSFQPQFDAYYDRMKDKVMSDVNSQSAARGAYGSNTALNNTIGAGLDVEAQRAKAATDFMFADSANQRDWQGMLGNQGRGADLSGLGIFDADLRGAQFGLDKTRLGGELAFKSEGMDFDKQSKLAELAFGLDDQALERMGAGVSTAFGSSDRHRDQLNDAFSAAGEAEDARARRINTLYDQKTDFSQDVQQYFSQNYDQILNADDATFNQMIETMVAQTADERGWNQQQQARLLQELKAARDLIKGGEAESAAGG